MNKLLISCLLLLFAGLSPLRLTAQQVRIFNDRIRTVQVVAGERWLDMPIIQLNGAEQINISFDDMTHEYHRYVYSIEHCEADWQPSTGIFTADYLNGFAEGNTIDDVEESLNTNFLYTHYSFSLPNSRCQLKMSGNYRVTITDENENNRPVAQVCFMVVEPLMGVHGTVKTNTDRDINGRHQQLAVALNYSGITVTNPKEEIQTVVLQNHRWSTAVWDAAPQYTMSDGLRWEHCRDYIFNGWNEYHKFELLDTDHTTLGLESMQWDGSHYHAFIYPDLSRPSYIYDEDANGAFLIRNSDNTENETESDYVYVHFQLPSPYLRGEVYVNGQATYDSFSSSYRMDYNWETQAYEKVLLLKLGYYSYQYVWKTTDGQLMPVPTEGNFFQTENTYTMLVYYRRTGDRTWHLMAAWEN